MLQGYIWLIQHWLENGIRAAFCLSWKQQVGVNGLQSLFTTSLIPRSPHAQLLTPSAFFLILWWGRVSGCFLELSSRSFRSTIINGGSELYSGGSRGFSHQKVSWTFVPAYQLTVIMGESYTRASPIRKMAISTIAAHIPQSGCKTQTRQYPWIGVMNYTDVSC